MPPHPNVTSRRSPPPPPTPPSPPPFHAAVGQRAVYSARGGSDARLQQPTSPPPICPSRPPPPRTRPAGRHGRRCSAAHVGEPGGSGLLCRCAVGWRAVANPVLLASEAAAGSLRAHATDAGGGASEGRLHFATDPLPPPSPTSPFPPPPPSASPLSAGQFCRGRAAGAIARRVAVPAFDTGAFP